MKRNNYFNLIKQITYTALFSALIFVVTYFLSIQYANNVGYFNFSDSIILFVSICVNPYVGLISGIIGCSLADFLSGYFMCIPFTIIAKSLESILGYIIYKKINNKYIKYPLFLTSLISMVLIYFIYYLIVYSFDFKSSIIFSGFDFIQAILNYCISLFLIFIYSKIPYFQKFNNNNNDNKKGD